MKKSLNVFLVLILGVFIVGTVNAAEYTVTVNNGRVIANADGVDTSSFFPTNSIANLDTGYDPYVSDPTVDDPSVGIPLGTWNAAGWWEFSVTGSSGADWNDVFASDMDYVFTSDWEGGPVGDIHFGTVGEFDEVYGNWNENRPSVYTYFGLYVPPNTGGAQTEAPTGIFAFLANEDGAVFDQWDDLYRIGELTDISGTGTFTATAAPVPEPATMLLLGSGIIGLAGFRRKFRKK